MPERISKRKKTDHDFAVNAFRVVQEATHADEEEAAPQQSPSSPQLSPDEKHAAAVALGRLGGLKGGKARMTKMTPEQRSEIARKAAAKRWGKPLDL
jgi:hypothetical protein